MVGVHLMAFYIQLLWCPELMGICLVSSKTRSRFVTFGCLLCRDVFMVGEGSASDWDPQPFLRIKLLLLSFFCTQANIRSIHFVCHADPLFSQRNFPEVLFLSSGMLTGWSMSPVQQIYQRVSSGICADGPR